MPMIAITPISLDDDYEAVYALWDNAGAGIHLRRSDSPAEIQKKLACDPDLFLVARAGDLVVGAVMGGFDGRRGMMYHLAVAREYRRQGIANQLVDALEERLKAKGCIRYYLLVTKDNEEAIRFYQSRGWENMDDLYAFAKDLAV